MRSVLSADLHCTDAIYRVRTVNPLHQCIINQCPAWRNLALLKAVIAAHLVAVMLLVEY